MKKYLTLILLFLFSPVVLAFSQQDLIELLQKPENSQGRFVQQRFLKSLTKPMITRGKFVLVTNHGLLWQMEKPFVNNLRVTGEGIMQWNGKNWIANNKMGQSTQINLFLGLLAGDTSELSQHFNFVLTGVEKNWTLTLTPSSLLMRQIFIKIEVKGDKNVKQIELFEKQGDRTLIKFDNIRVNQKLSKFAQQALE